MVGPTGSGKTTLMHLLLKMYPVPEQSIYIGGKDITEIPAKAVREQAGFVPQDGFLFSASIRDNIKFYQPGATDEDMVRAAKLASVHDDITAFPDGYDTPVSYTHLLLWAGQSAFRFSTGLYGAMKGSGKMTARPYCLEFSFLAAGLFAAALIDSVCSYWLGGLFSPI